jgi:hypothetical protein
MKLWARPTKYNVRRATRVYTRPCPERDDPRTGRRKGSNHENLPVLWPCSPGPRGPTLHRNLLAPTPHGRVERSSQHSVNVAKRSKYAHRPVSSQIRASSSRMLFLRSATAPAETSTLFDRKVSSPASNWSSWRLSISRRSRHRCKARARVSDGDVGGLRALRDGCLTPSASTPTRQIVRAEAWPSTRKRRAPQRAGTSINLERASR